MTASSEFVRAVSPEPSLLAHTSSESSGTFRQKARSLAPLNGWACAVKVCHDEMLEDTNSLDVCCGYSVESRRPGDFNEFPQRMQKYGNLSLNYPLSLIGSIKILTYRIRGSWVYLPYLFTNCVSRSCDLLDRVIQTCIG